MAFFSAQSHKYLLPNLLHNDEVARHIDTAGFVSTIELDYYNSFSIHFSTLVALLYFDTMSKC